MCPNRQIAIRDSQYNKLGADLAKVADRVHDELAEGAAQRLAVEQLHDDERSTLVLADLVARWVIPGAELPVGVVTALVGAPMLVGLVLRRRSGGR